MPYIWYDNKKTTASNVLGISKILSVMFFFLQFHNFHISRCLLTCGSIILDIIINSQLPATFQVSTGFCLSCLFPTSLWFLYFFGFDDLWQSSKIHVDLGNRVMILIIEVTETNLWRSFERSETNGSKLDGVGPVYTRPSIN